MASRRIAWCLCVLIAGYLFSGSPADAAAPTTLTFDTDASGAPLVAPKVFAETTPLTELYASLGVHFSGPGADLGGAILDEDSGLGTARSGRNFLAFNRRTYGQDPETVRFDQLQRRVTIFPGNNTEVTFTATAYRGSTIVDTDTATTPVGGYVELTVAADQGIDRVVYAEDGVDRTFVFDDLTLTPLEVQPGSKEECKNGGWNTYVDDHGRPFRNQGQCIAFVNH